MIDSESPANQAGSVLDELLCFAMYTASHATTQAYREVLAPWKLTYTQYLVLVVLATGERRVSDLGDDLGLDSGTLSPLLRRLEQRGLVDRRRDRGDERVVVVSLTDEGRRTRESLVEAIGCLVPAFTSSGVDLGQVMHALGDITVRMREITAAQRQH